MPQLCEQKCQTYKAPLAPLSKEEITQLKPQIPQWTLIELEGKTYLQRTYQLPDFKSALLFTTQVGEAARLEKHHPALLTEYCQVTVTWRSPVISGLHKNDFIMAAKTDQIAANCIARVLMRA